MRRNAAGILSTLAALLGLLLPALEHAGDGVQGRAPGARVGHVAEQLIGVLLDADVRQSIARIKASPFIPRTDAVRGFVYDVHTGELREVDA